MRTHHSGVGILGTVAERRRQRGGAALVVVGILAVVDGAVYADGPHAGRVTIAVAVVIFAAVAAGPNVNISQSVSTLNNKAVLSHESSWL